MKLVAYLRVSTDRQAERGLGLGQEQAFRSWARVAGHRIVAWHRDEGASGTNGIDLRIGLGDAIAALRTVDGLVVYRLDRLARDLVVQETIPADVQRRGKRAFSTFASEDAVHVDDPADPSRNSSGRRSARRPSTSGRSLSSG